jgi:hypothetical protein
MLQLMDYQSEKDGSLNKKDNSLSSEILNSQVKISDMLSPHQLIKICDSSYPLILSTLFFFENIFLTQLN